MTTEPESPPACDTLYYDGSCPLCRREIDKLARWRGGDLTLVDIHSLDDDVDERDRLLRRLHMKTADGEWVTGLTANVRAWRDTPLRWLGRLLQIWPFKPIAEWVYDRWAEYRYRRHYGRDKH